SENAAAVKRFSSVAGVALGVVIATGAARAIDQVGSWTLLVSTAFGRLVLVKSAFLLALAGLGAVNRYRHVPRAPHGLPGRRTAGQPALYATGSFGYRLFDPAARGHRRRSV